MPRESSDNDFKTFLTEVDSGTTYLNRPNDPKWSVATFRTLNTLINLNVSDMSMSERAWDGAATAGGVTKGLAMGFCQRLYGATQYTANLALQGVVNSWRHVTGDAPDDETPVGTNLPLSDTRHLLESPDFYLFLLTSPAVRQSMAQGGIGFLTQAACQIMDRLFGSNYTTMGQIDSIGQLLQKHAKETFPGIKNHKDDLQKLVNSIAVFLQNKCDIPYTEKKDLCRKIANLVTVLMCDDKKMTMGEKVDHIIDFAKESGVLKQVVIDNRDVITKVACDIWEQNSSATELIGFDKKAVGALRPVIDLVLEKGFDPQSYDETRDFLKTLVNMLTMEHSDVDTPGLVQLTDKLFAITTKNMDIRHRLASHGQADLTAESIGLREFFRGFFVNLFRQNGLQARLQNQLKILDEQQDKAVEYLSNIRATGPLIASLKSTVNAQKQKLEEALAQVQHPELNQRALYTMNMLKLIEKKEALEKNKAGWSFGRIQKQQLERVEAELNTVVRDYHLDQALEDYKRDKKAGKTIKDISKKIQDEITRTDPVTVYRSVDRIITESRAAIDKALTECQLEPLSYCKLESFQPHLKARLLESARKNKFKEKDLRLLIANSEIQDMFHRAKMIDLDPRKGRIKLSKIHSMREEKNVVKMLENRMQKKSNWFMRLLVNILSGVYLPNWMRRGQMDTIARSIKVYIALNPNDKSDTMRILKSLEMIINHNPRFWQNLMIEQGDAIKDLVAYAMADSQGDYVLTQPEYMQGCIRNIFDYVIRNAIINDETYKPVNLLLSVWADPSAFDKRYKELDKDYRTHRETVAKYAGKCIAKIIGTVRGWVGQEHRKDKTHGRRS